MRAAAIQEFGGPEKIRIMDLPRPLVGPDIVLIKTSAAGVNPVDFKVREGRLAQRAPHHFPIVLGWDVAGVVEAVGPAVTMFRPGDRVCAYARKFCIEQGTYAEYVAVVEESVAFAPATVDLTHAAALPLASLTAFQTVQTLDVSAGDTILVHGGSGGVGSFAVQLLAELGATVLATASSHNHEYLESLGATPIDRHGDLAAQVHESAPGGVEGVLDLAGGPDAVRASLDITKDGGRLCSILGPPDLGEDHLGRGLSARYVYVRPYGSQLAHLVAQVDAGALRINLHDTFSLDQAAEAHRALQAGGVRGKLALTVSG